MQRASDEAEAVRRVMWRRRAAISIFGLWGLISLVRLSRLVEPPEVPPGPETASVLDFFRTAIPVSAGYLYVEPGVFGDTNDSGAGQRLRYELYPRPYDKVRPTLEEAAVRELMRAENLTFVVVPDAVQYAPTFWVRQPGPWLNRIELDANRYVLAVVG